MSNFSKKIRESLEDILAYNEGKIKLRTTEIELPEAPQYYKAKDIKSIRERGRYSQGIFAKILNVSVKTVQSWESGKRNPSHCALRLLEIIDKGIYEPTLRSSSRKR